MKLEFLPLLNVQRDIYNIPPGGERFRAYLSTMIDPQTRDLKLPIVSMNPMGKDHIPALLDAYLSFDADRLAARAVSEAAQLLEQVPGEFRVTLVISDDAMGGWTNRYFTEFSHRFNSKPYFRRGWLVGILWTSEKPSTEATREEVLTTVFRGAHIQQHGFARTLRDMLRQEGYAMAMAACSQPPMEEEELAYTRDVIAPYLEARDQPTLMGCLYGDEVAASLGYSPLGLSLRAGIWLALEDARVELCLRC
jgi:hypothetical protein